MRITLLGIILCLKNLGIWLATWKIAQVKIDIQAFLWAFGIYVLMNIPSDLYLANHFTDKAISDYVKKAQEGVV